jgi:hypothetical protein
MAGRGKAMATVVKLGVKYGPAAYEAVKHGREPAQAAAVKAYSRLSARRQALAHAAVVVDGSVAKAFADDQQVWVVFSADEPVASHPSTGVPLADLLRHADPTKRIRPDEVGRSGRRKRADARSAADLGPIPQPTTDEP